MRFVLTAHAKQRMLERKVMLEEIRETIDMPDYTIAKDDKVEFYKRLNQRELKVIGETKGNFIKIITIIIK